jgi:hypothetical protein
MSRKNNVNADHYKMAGTGRPWEGADDMRKRTSAHAASAAPRARETFLPGARARRLARVRLDRLRRKQRLRRTAKVKGLTARQLAERRMRLRRSGQV